MERLALLMDELFSLSISEGAICNILARAREPLLDATAAIEKVVLTSPVVCSDETSVRVKGENPCLRRGMLVGGAADASRHISPLRGRMGVHRHAGGVAHDPAEPPQGGGNRTVR